MNTRLEEIMVNSFQDVVKYSDTHRVHNRIAAYMLALDRVAFAIEAARPVRLMQGEPTTPLMWQYHSVKQQVPNTLLLFRLGDFYELFYDDAVTAARELEITLTSRNKDKADAVPMCGVPNHRPTATSRNWCRRATEWPSANRWKTRGSPRNW